MFVFALYVPQPSERWYSIAFLAIVFLVLCGCAYRAKLSVWQSGLAMLIGTGVVLVLLLNSVWNADLGGYGDTAREWSDTNYSDAFFAVTYHMHVGWWKVYVFAGMIGGLLCVAAAKAFSSHRRGPQQGAQSL